MSHCLQAIAIPIAPRKKKKKVTLPMGHPKGGLRQEEDNQLFSLLSLPHCYNLFTVHRK